jgi:hypothetical protein
MSAVVLSARRSLPALPRVNASPAGWRTGAVLAGCALWLTVQPVDVFAQKGSAEEALKRATETADQIRSTTGAAPAPVKLPAGDPCAILPLAEVRKVFPGAKAGERSRRLEEYGSTECGWKDAKGLVLVAVQESYSKGSAREDVEGLSMGFTDPLNPQARKAVKIEGVAGLGEDAAAFVERADAARGILSDGAMLSVRRGEHTIWLMTNQLSRRDRAEALKSLGDLGRVAAKRL